MKKLFVLSAALAASGVSMAQDVGTVVSSTPVMQQVGVPRQVCTTEEVAIQQPKSGAGAVIGAIAGGVLGSNMGGQGAGTVIGAIGGAVVGDRLESDPPAQVQNLQRCGVQTLYENRAVAYNVVYEFAGKQYAVQLPYDPGPNIELQITPAGAQNPPPINPSATAQTVYPQPIYTQAPTVMVSPSVYPGYYALPYYYPLVGIQLGFGFRAAGRHGHRHGR